MKHLFFKLKKKFLIFFGIYVFLFFSFPLICYAEGESASPSPSPTPSPIPVPSGYTSFGNLFNVQESNIYTMENTNCSDLPTGYINPCSWNDGSFGSNMFDGDLSNGEIILPDSVLTANIAGLKWSDQAQDFVSYTFGFSDFPYYYISRNTQYDTFDIYLTQNLPKDWSMSDSGLIGYRQIDGSSEEFTPYDLGDIYLICTAFYNNDPNVYVMELAQPQTVRYPTLDHLGQLLNPYTDDWAYDVYWGNYGLNTLFATNNGSIWTINPSERNGGTTLFYYSDENHDNIVSDILGSPHINITHVYPDPVYPDGSGGDDSNNMYMESADWKFNIPKYWGDMTSLSADSKYIANWGKGNIVFDGQINDYQIANASHFNLSFSFYIKMIGEYALGGIEDNGPVFRKFAGSYKLTEYTVPLQDFIDSGNLVGFNVKDIFDHSLNNDGFAFTNFMRDMSIYSKYRSWDWTISCSAKLVSGNYVSGNLQETYNFITQISKENSNTITDNTNPFYPEDDNGDPDFDPNDPNNTTTTKKDGINITITNNPTFNNTNNNNNNNANNLTGGNDTFNPFEFLINKFIDQNEATTDNFFDSTNLNPWFAIVQENFSFIPVSVWVVITAALTVMFSIIVIALIVSLVIKIIT